MYFCFSLKNFTFIRFDLKSVKKFYKKVKNSHISLKIIGLHVCFFAGLNLYATALQVDVSAKAGILINAKTGAVLWEKKAHELMYPASTTKMITALYAYEKKGGYLHEAVVAPYDAVCAVAPHIKRNSGTNHPPYRLEFGGTHMGIQTGEQLSFRSLLEGLLVASGNDAANVIAYYVSGSIDAFVDEMNRFVKEKGCFHTTLYQPHGLPHPEHKTTAYDLALLAREFLRHPTLAQIAGLRQAVRPKTNKQGETLLSQHNALLRPGRFYYPKAKGIKTGYTVDAGYCIVTAAEDEHRDLVVVLLGCSALAQRYQDAIALFDAAFNEKLEQRVLLPKGCDVFVHDYKGGAEPLKAVLQEAAVIHYYPSEEPVLKTQLIWDPVVFPVREGQKVGCLEVKEEGQRLVASFPIIAVKSVEAAWGYRFLKLWQGARGPILMSALGLLILGGLGYKYGRRSYKNYPRN